MSSPDPPAPPQSSPPPWVPHLLPRDLAASVVPLLSRPQVPRPLEHPWRCTDRLWCTPSVERNCPLLNSPLLIFSGPFFPSPSQLNLSKEVVYSFFCLFSLPFTLWTPQYWLRSSLLHRNNSCQEPPGPLWWNPVVFFLSHRPVLFLFYCLHALRDLLSTGMPPGSVLGLASLYLYSFPLVISLTPVALSNIFMLMTPEHVAAAQTCPLSSTWRSETYDSGFMGAKQSSGFPPSTLSHFS